MSSSYMLLVVVRCYLILVAAVSGSFTEGESPGIPQQISFRQLSRLSWPPATWHRRQAKRNSPFFLRLHSESIGGFSLAPVHVLPAFHCVTVEFEVVTSFSPPANLP